MMNLCVCVYVCVCVCEFVCVCLFHLINDVGISFWSLVIPCFYALYLNRLNDLCI